MKKVILFIALIAVAVSACGCGAKNNNNGVEQSIEVATTQYTSLNADDQSKISTMLTNWAAAYMSGDINQYNKYCDDSQKLTEDNDTDKAFIAQHFKKITGCEIKVIDFDKVTSTAEGYYEIPISYYLTFSDDYPGSGILQAGKNSINESITVGVNSNGDFVIMNRSLNWQGDMKSAAQQNR
ncbi:MAG TPA: hypothetical protein GX401_06875 [Clostridiales bacterium]|nr:hypothetical protein [Clostridiales bacterium]